MENGILKEKFEKYLIETVGEEPTQSEMKEIDKKVRVAFDKIYNKPDKDSKLIKDLYDRELSELWPRIVAHEATISEVDLFVKYSNINIKSQIASLASGIGVFEIFIAKEVNPEGKIFCIDISEGMSNKAQALVDKFKLKNIKVIVGDITKLPFESNSLDIVLIRRSGLSNDKRWIDVLKESLRVLKKKEESRLVYTVDADFTKPKKQIIKDLKNAGLDFVDIDMFTKKDGDVIQMITAKPVSS